MILRFARLRHATKVLRHIVVLLHAPTGMMPPFKVHAWNKALEQKKTGGVFSIPFNAVRIALSGQSHLTVQGVGD
jgi:hypothetical protein